MIDVLSSLDPLGRGVGVLETEQGRDMSRPYGGQRVSIPTDAGWTGWEVEQLLASYGIGIYGRGFWLDTLYFRVPSPKAEWAELVLLAWEVPIVSGTINPDNPRYAATIAAMRAARGAATFDYARSQARPKGIIAALGAVLVGFTQYRKLR